MHSDDVVALLADAQRLRVVAALVLGAGTTDEVAARSALTPRVALTALTRLAAGGLVTRTTDGGWTFDLEALRWLAREARPREEADDVGDVDRDTARVLRTFLRGGRLTQIPLHRQKRLIVLDHLCRVFEVVVHYPEKEVNTILRAFHLDTAALRRYLVDEGFLSREKGLYWRTGGSVEL